MGRETEDLETEDLNHEDEKRITIKIKIKIKRRGYPYV
jgi:hypothetical protein